MMIEERLAQLPQAAGRMRDGTGAGQARRGPALFAKASRRCSCGRELW